MGYINLNKKSFFHNAEYYTKLLGDKNKICIALKDNAYGHGIEPMAQLSQEFGIRHTMVRNTFEADIAAERASAVPAGRFGNTVEFGETCAFLCGANAGYITSQNLLIDGGRYPGTF